MTQTVTSLPPPSKTEDVPSRPHDKADYQPTWADKLKKAFGTHSSEVATTLLEQTVAGSFHSHLQREKQLFAVYDMLLDAAPKDPLEAMIVPQMVTVHFQAMELMRQAAVCSIPEASSLYLNLATKLMRTYAQQMEALRKNRQKGRQEIRVEHINITGGQNILGNVAHPGEGEKNAKIS